MRDVLDLRQRGAGEPHERGPCIRALEDVAERLFGSAGRDADVDRREDAAIEGHQVRRERHRAAGALLDFGAVAVVEHAVGRQAVVALGEVRPLGRGLAGTRHTGLRVDDDVGAGDEETGVNQRRQREQRGGRVAARIGDEAGRRHGVALALGQAVGEARGQLVRFRIPARARAGIAQPERA